MRRVPRWCSARLKRDFNLLVPASDLDVLMIAPKVRPYRASGNTRGGRRALPDRGSTRIPSEAHDLGIAVRLGDRRRPRGIIATSFKEDAKRPVGEQVVMAGAW